MANPYMGVLRGSIPIYICAFAARYSLMVTGFIILYSIMYNLHVSYKISTTH